MGTEYLIDNYLNTFEFGSKTYTMLNEHLDVLHEMEFINTNNNMHKRIRMYPSLLYYLETFPIIPLDLMKCPQEASNEASIAVLGFIANKQLIENDIKYQKFMSGECDAYYIQKGQEFVQQVLGK